MGLLPLPSSNIHKKSPDFVTRSQTDVFSVHGKHGSAWNHQFSLLCNLHCHKYSWLGDLVSPIKPYKNHCLSFEGEVIMCPNVQWYGHASIPIRKSHIAASTRSIHVSETSCDDPTKYNFWWCSISNSWYGLMHIYIYMQKKHNIT